MKKCVIVGAGTYGQVYATYLKDEYDVVGFFDDNISLKGKSFLDIKVLGTLEDLNEFEDLSLNIFVPIGNNKVRVNILKNLEQKGFNLPSFIHKSTCIHETVSFGKSVYILPSVSIMPFTTVGDYTMISMGVNIAHHVDIKEGCFFSQGTNIGASMSVGKEAYIGISATTMTGVKNIGEKCLVGAAAVVIKDVPKNAVVVGNPGRILRIKDGE